MASSSTHSIVAVLLDAWVDLDRVVRNLSAEAAAATAGGSAHASTLGHLANQVDSWISVCFAGHDPHPLLSEDRFRFGGDGRADEWEAICAGWAEVRDRAAAYLARLPSEALERTILYPGSLPEIAGRMITLRYTLLRVLAHQYFHIGEIASKRSGRGDEVGDYPGPLGHLLETDGG